MERIAAVLVLCTALVLRSWRFVLVLFLVRMWRRYAPPRLMLPLPRTRKRFTAPLLDFILGIALPFSSRMTPGGPRCGDTSTASTITCLPPLGGLCCNLRSSRLGLLRLVLCFHLGRLGRRRRALLLGRQHHHHLPAFQPGELLDHPDRIQILSHPLQQPLAELLVRHLAAAEAQRHFRLVALLQELDQLAELDLVVALVGAGAELDLLDLDLLLLELRLVRLLLLAVAELAVVHQLADRRVRERRDLHQVHVLLFGEAQGLQNRLDAELVTVFRH